MTRSGARRYVGLASGAGVAALALSACVVDVGTPPGYTSFAVVDVNTSGTVLVSANIPPVSPGDPGTVQLFLLDAHNQWSALRPSTPGTFPDIATAIGDDGKVVGTAFIEPLQGPCPFLLTPGEDAACIDNMQDVVRLGFPNDLNKHDTVVGSGTELQPDETVRGPIPVLWTPGGGTVALPLPAGATTGQATAINAGGTIVGVVGPTTADQRAVLWCPPWHQPVELPESSGAFPNAIDARGVILGSRFAPDGVGFQSIVWDSSPAHNLRVLPEGRAFDLDGAGAPVGFVTRDGLDVAARFDPDTLQTQVLGPADGRSAQALAAAGTQIVGIVSAASGQHVARFVGPLPSS
jgi:uncharacterized membrane protein